MGHKNGGPRPYGKDEREKEILAYILHARRQINGHKRKTFREIAEDLNVKGLFPRNAFKWNDVLVFYAHKTATEGGLKDG